MREKLTHLMKRKCSDGRCLRKRGDIKSRGGVWKDPCQCKGDGGGLKRVLPKREMCLGVARVAGIMAVKQTANLIPMCHTLLISKCEIAYEISEDTLEILARCTVKVEGKTGVEMEALTGVSVTLLTIYDMCKAIDRTMELSEIHLEVKKRRKKRTF